MDESFNLDPVLLSKLYIFLCRQLLNQLSD